MGKITAGSEVVVGQIQLKKKLFSRRRTRRAKSRRSATVELVGANGDVVGFERYQISAVGAYLFSEYLHCEGETLTLRLSLPSVETPLEVQGEVVNANVDSEPGMGVVFRKMSVRDKRVLQDYVAKRFVNYVK